ncbi:MAG TPA: flagellar hook capping FlgD N-terminal domain-containing protein [Nocardioidaceae bacterium]
MITPLSPALGGSAQPTTASATQIDRDMFLKLMVTQLKNQDPMNPTDSAEFLAQTAQFTSLEKLEEVADQSAQAYSAQMAFGASSLVGRTVTYTDADGNELSGTVSSVRFGPTGPVLGVGDAEVALDKVTAVEAAAAPATTTDTAAQA